MLRTFRKWVRRKKHTRLRALAFTCSRHRPLMLRHCIMQLQRQSYPIDHAIFVNSSENEGADHTTVHYKALFDDVSNSASGKVAIQFGKSKTPHENNVTALKILNVDDYDVFFKIDDDDIYRQSYVKDVVDHFAANHWDYSGTCSQGLLNGSRWYPNKVMTDLGLSQDDIDLGIRGIMPPSAAFSRKAIEVILQAPGSPIIEDIHWRRILARSSNLVITVRDDKNFIYNIHGGNMSTGSWLKP